MSISLDPDQTAPVIWVNTVCPDLSVPEYSYLTLTENSDIHVIVLLSIKVPSCQI